MRQVPSEGSQPQDNNWMSFLFSQDAVYEQEISAKEKEKVELFEKGLSMQLKKSDTIDGAVQTMVKVALAAEFGPSLLHQKGAQSMVSTICQGILSDSTLRRQALIILDRFAKS